MGLVYSVLGMSWSWLGVGWALAVPGILPSWAWAVLGVLLGWALFELCTGCAGHGFGWAGHFMCCAWTAIEGFVVGLGWALHVLCFTRAGLFMCCAAHVLPWAGNALGMAWVSSVIGFVG
jgi:hypothetical protein